MYKIKLKLVEKLISICTKAVERDYWVAYPLVRLLNLLPSVNLVILTLKDSKDLSEERSILDRSVKTNMFEPRTINEKVITQVCQIKEIGYLNLKGVTVNADCPIFRYSGHAFVEWTAEKEHRKHIKYPGRQLITNGERTALFRPYKQKTLKKGILLTGQFVHNWYHFLVETLSKTVLLEKLPTQYDDFVILVDSKILTFKNHFEVISRLVPTKRIVPLSNNIDYWIEECVVIDSPILASPTPINPIVLSICEFHFRPGILKLHISNLINKFHNAMDDSSCADLPRRIYLARSGHHSRPYNQNQLINLFGKYQFEPVYCENLSVSQQMSLFRRAEFIIGQSGAAWTNICFCTTGTKGLCFMVDTDQSKAPYFSNIAETVGVDLVYYFEKCNYQSWLQVIETGDVMNYNPTILESIFLEMVDK